MPLAYEYFLNIVEEFGHEELEDSSDGSEMEGKSASEKEQLRKEKKLQK